MSPQNLTAPPRIAVPQSEPGADLESETVSATAHSTSHVDPIVLRYDRPVLFYLLAVGLPWAFWIGAAFTSRIPDQSSAIQLWTAGLSIAGLVAPVSAVIILVWRRPELRTDIVRRLRWPSKAPWWILALTMLLLLGSIHLAHAVSLLFGYSVEQFGLRGGFTFTTGLVPVWFTLLGAALFEELAWHSYGTDTLLRRFNVFAASMIFAVIWTLWHAPLSLIDGFYQAEIVEAGWLHTLNFPVSLVAFVVLMNWLYFRSGRNIWVPVAFHMTANIVNEIFLTDPDTKLIQTAILLVVSALVLVVDRRLFFSSPHRI